MTLPQCQATDIANGRLRMMRMPADIEQLRRLVESRFGGPATLLYSVPVRHATGELLWEGVVHVLELRGNPNATEAYAWTCPFDGEDHAALKIGNIQAPIDAVRAALQVSGWGPNFNEKRAGCVRRALPESIKKQAPAGRSADFNG